MNIPKFFTFPDASGSSPKEGSIHCELCPRRCLLAPGTAGPCKVRFNRDGKPALPYHGYITALALDPIEKKPLYHFRPGSEILSIGFAGCNLRCPFCQNWHISQTTDVPGRIYSPSELIAAAGKNGQIAYTYSEPLVHAEFLLDCMNAAREAGIANVLVSNGCINSGPASEILDLCDAANIDLKCFSKESYARVLGGELSAVLGFIRTAVEKGVHLELTTLVVPGLNDSETELNKCMDFIAELEKTGNTVPWHLSAYHPAYKWSAPPTDPQFLLAVTRQARKKIRYVYTGNIAAREENNDTLCPHCGKVLVSRRGYRIDTSGLLLKKDAYFCASCGGKAPIGN